MLEPLHVLANASVLSRDLADALFEPGALRAGVIEFAAQVHNPLQGLFDFCTDLFCLLEIGDLAEAAFHQENRFLDRERFFYM